MSVDQYSRRQLGRLGLAAAIAPAMSRFAGAADESGKPAAGKIGDFKISLANGRCTNACLPTGPRRPS